MNRQWLELDQRKTPSEGAGDEITFSLKEVFSVVRRRIGIISSTVILCVLVAGGYVFTTKPVYDGSAIILIDPSQPCVLADDTPDAFLLKDNLVVESEIEVIKSGELLKRIANEKNIYSDPEFITPSLVSQAKKWIYKELKITGGGKLRDGKVSIFAGFRDRVKAKRIGLTYAIRINYESTDPERAAGIANAIAQAYLDDSLNHVMPPQNAPISG